jgi:16S rRNA (guanine527-N7)-methyltransferase
MDEAAAKCWLVGKMGVSRETLTHIDAFVALLKEESGRQNLVSTASLEAIWCRHIADSAQLLDVARRRDGAWIDLGSGAGLPGLVVAILAPDARVALVESRRLRFEWLSRAADALGLRNVSVEPLPVERVESRKVDVITARAFAPLPKLLALAHRFSTEETAWILPKGRSAAAELASVRDAWQGDFSMEPSVTDPESAIIVARNVRLRARSRA